MCASSWLRVRSKSGISTLPLECVREVTINFFSLLFELLLWRTTLSAKYSVSSALVRMSERKSFREIFWLKWCASHGNRLTFFWSSLSYLFPKWCFHVSVEHQSDLIIVFSYVTNYAVSKILIRLHLVSLGNRVYDSCSIDDDYTWYADGWFVSSSVCVLYRSQIHTKINELRWLFYSNRAAEGETFHQLLVHWTCI